MDYNEKEEKNITQFPLLARGTAIKNKRVSNHPAAATSLRTELTFAGRIKQDSCTIPQTQKQNSSPVNPQKLLL